MRWEFKSLRGRLIFAILCLLTGVQCVGYVVVADANRRIARAKIETDLRQGAAVFERILEQRVAELRLGAQLLSRDYAFTRTFAAIPDFSDPVGRNTIVSMLENYRRRLGDAASLSLAGLDGSLLASTSDANVDCTAIVRAAEARPDLQAALVQRAGKGWQLVVAVPLLGPEPLAWVLVGYGFDDALAADLAGLSGLSVALCHRADHSELIGSSLPVGTPDWVPAAGFPEGRLFPVTIANEAHSALAMPVRGDVSGSALVVILQSVVQEMRPFDRLETALLVISLSGLVVSAAVGIAIARGLSTPILELARGVRRIEDGRFGETVTVTGKDEVGRLAEAFNKMSAGLAERDRVRDLLGKVVSPEIAHSLLASGVELGGEERTVTVMFTDLRGFTALSETLTPTILLAELNDYFTVITTAIEAEGGVVDKYVGDSVMALFGAPVSAQDHADRALRAARMVMRKLDELNQQRIAAGKSPFETGIGINSGHVIAGNMGSTRRLNYTVIGHAVNLASRLQGLTKEPAYKARVIVSEFTRRALRDQAGHTLRPLGDVSVRGSSMPLPIHSLEG